jgi:hypothetical protein
MTLTEWAAESEAPEPEVNGSVIANLRRRAAELQVDDHVDLEVPGYDGQLVARYRALGMGQVRKMIERAERQGAESWDAYGAADGLAVGLIELFGRREDGSLGPIFTDQPARYDSDLADALGLTVPERTARAVILEVFGGGEKAEWRVGVHFQRYVEWLQGTRDGSAPGRDFAERAVGESPED